MTTTAAAFDQLRQTLADGGVAGVLDQLTEQLKADRQHHELFQARRMQLRHRLGLPLLQDVPDSELDEGQRQQLEAGLLGACREVGLLLIGSGQVRDGWGYLRAVGDRDAAAQAMAELEVDDENLDELVEVAVHEGVDVARGFQLVLDHFGTCNAITTFEQALPQQSREDQRAAAGLLVRHLHKELLSSVQADVAQQEDRQPEPSTLADLVRDRDWLFNENTYHTDTTHLASAVRFARLMTDLDDLRLALDLTHYGRRLSQQFQYQHDEPFSDYYPAHGIYFQALLGEAVDEAVAYFRVRAEQADVAEQGTGCLDVAVELMDRVGRYDEALQLAIRLSPAPADVSPYHPPSALGLGTLLDLARRGGQFDALLDHCRQREDLLGFAAALVQSQSQPTEAGE